MAQVKRARKNMKKQADDLWRDLVKAKGYCEAAGRWPHSCSQWLEAAHIEGRANHRLRWELYNGLSLCSGSHNWFTNHPIAWGLFVETHFPDQWQQVREHINEAWDKDYDVVLERLKARMQEVA